MRFRADYLALRLEGGTEVWVAASYGTHIGNCRWVVVDHGYQDLEQAGGWQSGGPNIATSSKIEAETLAAQLNLQFEHYQRIEQAMAKKEMKHGT